MLMTSRKPLFLALLLALGQVSVAYAQDADTSTATTTATQGKQPITIGEVEKTAPPERGTGSLTKELVKHASPNENFQSILRNIPGFTVISSGPGNLTTSDSTFTYQGFSSDQMGVNFDGVPLINTFRGGTNGQGDDHALTPIGMGQFSGVKVYSGANSPSETGINALGGTIDYSPTQPTKNFNVTVAGSGGVYAGGTGDSSFGGFTINSGTLPYIGARLLASYNYQPYQSYIQHVHSINNNYYVAGILPYNHGMSQLSLYMIYNHELAQFPERVPVALLDKYGRDFQWAPNIYANWNNTSSFTNIIGWKSIINAHLLAKAKFFVTQDDNDRTAYSNASYKGVFDGFLLPTSTKSYANPSSSGRPDNTYNPTALFGSSYNGTQYQRYIDNFGNVGFAPSLDFLLPHNVLTLGGQYIYSQDHSAEYWYGSYNVPTTDGYNDAWDEHDQRQISDVYLQDRLSLLHRHLTITPGVKYYIVSTNCDDIEGYYYNYGGSVGNTFYYWEPSFGISYLANKDVDLYFHYGRVYKVPNISAYYAVIGDAPTPGPVLIKPEDVDSFDTGVRYNAGPLKTSLAYFLRLFHNKFGYYYNGLTGITYQYNVGSALYQGFTASADLQLPDRFNAFANYTLTAAHFTSNFDAGQGIAVTAGESVARVPTYNLNFGLGYHIAGISARLTDHLVGAQYINTNKGVNSLLSLHPYNVTDLNLGYTWRPMDMGVKKVYLNLYVDNLFNAKYYSSADLYLGSASEGGHFVEAQVGAPTFVGADVKATF
jgi:outer membrane receptor protein involved in Fe transport